MVVTGILFLVVGWYFFVKKSVRNYFGITQRESGIEC